MQVEVIDDYGAFQALETTWNDLYRKDPDAQYFLSWTWLSSVFRDHPGQWRVLAVRPCSPDAGYVGFLPIRLKTIWSRSRRMFRNEVHMAGRLAWAQYTGFLADPACEAAVAASLAGHLQTMHWSRLSLKYLDLSERRTDLFLKQFPERYFKKSFNELAINKGETDNLVCPYVDLPDDYETHLQTQLSANSRQKIRRYLRQIEASDDLRITEATPETIQRDLDILVDLWRQQWTGSKGDRTKELSRTYRQILENGFAAGALYLPVLWRGESPIGALGSLVDRQKRRLFFIVSGRDETRKELFIGVVLHAHSIRWAIENGIRIYDFCHGDEVYKYSYGAKNRRVGYVTIRARGGINRNGTLDPWCVDDVMAETMRFMRKGRLNDAHIACQQVQAAVRRARYQEAAASWAKTS